MMKLGHKMPGDRVTATTPQGCGKDLLVPAGATGIVTEVRYTHIGTRVVWIQWEGQEYPIGYSER